jgi:hypothetical protein
MLLGVFITILGGMPTTPAPTGDHHIRPSSTFLPRHNLSR